MNSQGFWLLDLLRRRRELPLQEVVRLCADLPRIVDARGHREERGVKLLADAWIGFPDEGVDPARLRTLLEAPVTSWPSFTIMLGQEHSEDQDLTMAGPILEEEGATGTVAFARLLFELLGGVHRGGAGRKVPPLPALNEEGNAILRDTIARKGERESCGAFWERWLRGCEVYVPPSLWRIPRWLLNVAEPGTQLCLEAQAEEPTDWPLIPVMLVARPVFRIGRSRSLADFATKILNPDDSVDEAATVQVSRVQVLGEIGEAGATFRDGDGRKGSANGTLWNGRPLASDRGTPIGRGGELALGGVYRMTATLLPAPGQGAVIIENIAEWKGTLALAESPSLFSAVLFRPLEGQPLTRDAVWLGSGIGFGIGRDGNLAWEIGGVGKSSVHILRAQGCFWLANAALQSGDLRLSEAALGPGQIAPLASGQTLELRGRRFLLTVS